MKKFRVAAWVAGVCTAGLLASCDGREKIEYYDQGSVSLSALKTNLKVVIDPKLVETTPGTKADPTVDLSNFIVRVVPVSFTGAAQEWTYSNVPEIVTLKTGDYKIEALSHQAKEAEWEKPCYTGGQDFTIRKSDVTTIDAVTCKLSNVGVRIKYSATLLKELDPSFTVSVTNGVKTGILPYGISESRTGYFKPGPLTIVLEGKRTDGEVVKEVAQIPNPVGGEVYDVTMNAVLVGVLQAKIKVDMSAVEVTRSVNVPLKEEVLVDPDDPGGSPDPAPVLTIKGRNGLDISKAITYPANTAKAVIVDFTAESGIRDLWVEIESPFLTEEELGSLGIPKKFNLADLSPELETSFRSLGLIGNDPIRDSRSMTFDITAFTSLLTADTHKFHLTISDNYGQSVPGTLTLQPTK